MSLLYFFILCIMGLASQFSSIRVFQDVERRLPKLFKAIFDGILMNLSKPSESTKVGLSAPNGQAHKNISAAAERPGWPAILSNQHHFKHLSESGHLCKLL